MWVARAGFSSGLDCFGARLATTLDRLMRLRSVLMVVAVTGCQFTTQIPVDATGFTDVACAGPLDCPQGLSCSVLAERCFDARQLATDAGVTALPCEAQGDCLRPLTCALGLGRCVQLDEVAVDAGVVSIPCSSTLGCPSPFTCALGLGACVKVDALELDAGVTPVPCSTTLGCPAPFTCALGLGACVKLEALPVDGGLTPVPCSATQGCPSPFTCALGLGACVDTPTLGTDGGVSVLPCESAGECPSPFTCAAGLRRCVQAGGLFLDGGISLVPCSVLAPCPSPLTCALGASRCVAVESVPTVNGVTVLPCTNASECPGQLVCARSLGACVDPKLVTTNDAGVSQLPCQRTDDCPNPFVCSTLGLCADATVLSLPAFQSVVLVDASGVTATRFGVQPPTNTGKALVTLAREAVTVDATLRAVRRPCTQTGSLTWECPLLAAAPSSTEQLEVRALGLSGTGATERVQLVIDADPPRLIPSSASLVIVPALSNPRSALGPLFAPTRLNATSELQLTLVVDDPNTVVADVSFQTTGGPLPRVSRTGAAFTFRGVVPAGEPEGVLRLSLSTRDDVGNELLDQRLDMVMVSVDRLAPAPLDVTSPSGLLVERLPYGDGVRQGTYLSMSRAPEGLLLFRDAPGGTVLLPIASVGATPLSARLSALDVPAVYAEVVDEAGNSSAVAHARRFRLTLTPGGPGNPSTLASSGVPTPPAHPGRIVESGGQLTTTGTGIVSVKSLPSWEPLVLVDQPASSVSHVLFEDTPRQRLIRDARPTFGPIGQTGVPTDVAGGRLVMLPPNGLRQPQVGACSTDDRHCLTLSLFSMGTANVTIHRLDDMSWRLLRSFQASPGAEAVTPGITWSPRTQTYFLAAGSRVYELDALGIELGSRPSGCSPFGSCQIAATPEGLYVTGSSAAQWLLYDGGVLPAPAPSLGADVTLAWDRERQQLYARSSTSSISRLVAGVWQPVQLLRPNRQPCVTCSGLAFDPVSREVRSTENDQLVGPDGGSERPPPIANTRLMGIAAGLPPGFAELRAAVQSAVYRDGFGWLPTPMPLVGGNPIGTCNEVRMQGVRIDGGVFLPCQGTSAFYPDNLSPMNTVNTPSPFMTVVDDGVLFESGFWRPSNGFVPFALPLVPALGSLVVRTPRGATSVGRNTQTTEYSDDGGVWSRAPAVMSGMLPSTPVAAFTDRSMSDAYIATTAPDALHRFVPAPLVGGVSELVATPTWLSRYPPWRQYRTVASLGNGRFLWAGDAQPPVTDDIWKLSTRNQASLSWRMSSSTISLPHHLVVRASFTATLHTDAGVLAPVDLVAWDAWAAKWRVLGNTDGGVTATGEASFEITPIIELGLQQAPSLEPMQVDRLEASFDYVLP